MVDYSFYEKDEVIRQAKKKPKKERTAKSKHKHVYTEKFVPKDGTFLNLDRTEMVCSICGKVGQTRYHWQVIDRGHQGFDR